MPNKSEKRKSTKRKRNRITSNEAASILRAIGNDQTFHFYEAFGKPTGVNASSLQDLHDRLRSVKLETLQFHLQGKDIQNWIRQTVGDLGLAKEIDDILYSNNEKTRNDVCKAIEKRLKELQILAAPFTIDGSAATAKNLA